MDRDWSVTSSGDKPFTFIQLERYGFLILFALYSSLTGRLVVFSMLLNFGTSDHRIWALISNLGSGSLTKEGGVLAAPWRGDRSFRRKLNKTDRQLENTWISGPVSL